jgi:hypothetical protein
VKRRKPILIASLLCLLFVSSVALVFLLYSETASKYIINRLCKLTHHALTVERVQGRLLTGLNLNVIKYNVDQQHILVDHAQLVLSPFELLGGTLHLSRVELTGVTCSLAEDAEQFSDTMLELLPGDGLPFEVLADDVRLNGVVLRHGDRQYPVGQIDMAAEIVEQRLYLKRFEVKEKAYQLELTGDTKLISPYPFQAALRWMGQYKGYRFRGKTDINGTIGTVKFNHQLFEPRYIGVGGEVQVSRLSPRLYQLGITGTFNGQDIPPAGIHLAGQLDPRHLNIEKLTVSTLGGKINATGDMHWQSSLQWDLNIDGTAIDPGQQWALWKGRLDLGARVSGQLNAGAPLIRISEIDVAGDLLDQPFRTSGDVFFNDTEIKMENLNVRSGNNQLALNGTASRDSNLRFEFDVPDPVNLWTGIYGSLRGNGRVKGDLRAPVGTLFLDGFDMRYGDYQLEKAAATIQIDLNHPAASSVQARLHDFRVGDQYFSDISVDGTGDFKKHRASVDVVSPSTTMNIGFAGSCVKDNCEINVDAASFRLQQYGPWQLLNPVQLRAGPGEIKPFRSCWVQDKSDICLSGSWNDSDGWKTEGDVDAPAVSSILAILKDVLNKEHLGWDTHNGQ